jgi:hypothetical protein
MASVLYLPECVNRGDGRVAADLSMSTNTLRGLFAREPHAADLLYDLQGTCACCNEKGVCEKDLEERPDDPVWKSYCPNAVTLETLAKLKAHSSA